MSTRVVRSLSDFIRHGMSIEVVCACGHRALLEPRWVYARFQYKGWSASLNGLGDSAYQHLFCSRCFVRQRGRVVRPVRIGPDYR